ncbi:hypothetical protein BOTBODRAFT_173944 [Botryobasidium botryosum FD-172 SS1]|uniref:DUF6593 domain-containing protein n=1 Tax=Botryobasidium botryosum (strain FD-172 SS1) TaxID=930990 RepID=A0A067ML72_BOTB1|nr:hypothetical protein BOTBODRAFT_173944 [Botryobasidium botryosum FD-172 SS1]
MPNTIAFTLYDLSGNLSADNEFRDSQVRTAYFIQAVRQEPVATKITRMTDWIAAPDHEPWCTWLYFSSGTAMQGWIKFGSQSPTPMGDHLRPLAPTSSTRCYTGLDGREYMWRHASRRLECYDNQERLLAVYEYLLDDVYFAKLDIKWGAEPLVTEIVTTLLLNRHAIRRSS